MSVFWRNLIITVVLAALAAFVGARLGSQPSLQPRPKLLRETVYQMVHHDLKLTPGQSAQIDKIDADYEHHRMQMRAQIGAADAELAQALANEMAIGTAAERALNHLQGAMGDLQRETVVYVLAVRGVLTPDQQMQLDRKIFDSLTLGPF